MGLIKFEKLKRKKVKGRKYLKTLKYVELRKLINNDYLFTFLPKKEKIRIYSTNANNLYSLNRYDLKIKLEYIEAYITKHNYKIASEKYLKNIKAFNNYKEPDGKKSSEEEFIKKFNILIEDALNGKKIYKPVLISKSAEIIDGAHRVAVGMYFNMNIMFCVFNCFDVKYNEAFFMERS